MKLKKTASGKQTIKMSRKEWVGIGKTAKWLDRKALNKKAFDEEEWGNLSQYESMGEAYSAFDETPEQKREKLITMIESGELSESQVDKILSEEGIDIVDVDEDALEVADIDAQEEIAREQAAEEAAFIDAEEAAVAEEDPNKIRTEYLQQALQKEVGQTL